MKGNDSPCKVIGIGTVKMQMYDGIVWTLSYVPNLTKNLISLGTLEINGYKFTIGNKIMKISKGALTVLKARRFRSLYVLQGKTVIGTTAVSTSSMSEEETTKWWHLRLRHMSEKGMTMHSKRVILHGQSIGKMDFCEHCVFGKQNHVSFNTTMHRTIGGLHPF